MNKWEIKQWYLESRYIGMEMITLRFYREWCGVLYEKYIRLDSNVSTADSRELMETLFNEIHNKRLYKKYSIYELFKDIIFSKKDMGCKECGKKLSRGEGKFKIIKTTNPSAPWQKNVYLPKCNKCFVTEKLVR